MNVLSKLTAKGRKAAVLALGFATLFSGCKEEDPPAVSVDRPIIRTSMAEQTQPLRVISNTDWKATIDWEGGETNWITLPRTTGRGTTDILLYIEQCTSPLMSGRQATITFETTAAPVSIATVKVKQGHDEGVLELRPDQIEVGAAAGTVRFMVESNTQWQIVGLSDWATADPTSGEGNQVIEIDFEAYTSHGYDREARFMVTTTNLGAGENTSRDFILTQRDQEDPSLILGQETLYFEATNATPITVPVITNTDAAPFVTPSASWCEVTYNDGEIEVSVTDNETIDQRQCFITVIAIVDNATATKQITVTQAGLQDPKLIVTNANVTIDARPAGTAATIDFSVGFYTEPDGLEGSVTLVAGGPAWITATKNGNAVDFVAQPNPSEGMRQATFTLKLVNAGKTVTSAITVTQNGVGDMNLSATPLSLNAIQAGETLTFTVLADIPNVIIKVTSSDTWAVPGTPVAQTSTGGTIYSVPVVISANNDADSRPAVLTVVGTMGDQAPQVVTINIDQAGTGTPQAVLVRNTITVPKVGDDYQVGIYDTEGITGWSFSTSANWITDIDFNDTDGTIDFTVDDNTVSAANRTAVISIVAVKGGKPQQLSLEVIQLGTGSAELIISEQNIALPAGVAGTDISYTVGIEKLNGTEWTVLGYNPQDMITSAAENMAGTGLEIAVKPNTTTSPRNATITLIATNGDSTVPYTITVTQEGLKGPELVPLTSTVYVGKEVTAPDAETVVPFLNWDSSITLSVSATANAAMFGTTAFDDANLKIAVTANDGTEQRTGELTVVATRGGVNQVIKITVVQAGTGTPDLTIGSPAFMFGPAEQTDVNLFFVNENGATVTVASFPSWISEDTAINSDNGLWIFDVDENATNKDRSGEIVLKAVLGGKTVFYNVPVTQYGLESLGASLTVSSIQVDYDGGDPTTDIINLLNVPEGAVVNVYSTQTWLTLDGTNTSIVSMTAPYEITPTVEDNPRPFERIGTITFEITRGTESQVLTVSVMQHALPAPDALTIVAVPAVLNFDATDSSMDITIVNYESTLTYTVTPNANWLTVGDPDSDGVIEVEPNANPGSARTATITIVVKDAAGAIAQTVITVAQAGATDVLLILDHASVDFNATDTAPISVNVVNPDEDLTYDVVTGGDTSWFEATVSESVITVTPDSANDGEARAGTIVVSAENADGKIVASKVISVTQAAYNAPVLTLELGQASIEFGALEDDTAVNEFLAYATTGAEFAIASSASWIVAEIDSDGNVEVSPIGANDGGFRSGTVTITATLDGVVATKTITVTQEGVDKEELTLNVVPGALNFGAADAGTGSARTLTIADYVTGANYVVGAVDNWLTITAIDSDGKFTVTPTLANTGAARTTTISVAVGSLSQDITVTQAGVADVDLILDQYSVDFNASDTDPAGVVTVNIVNYDATLAYSAVAGGKLGWFTVGSISTSGVFTITPTANSGGSRTGVITVYAKRNNVTVATKEISVSQGAVNSPAVYVDQASLEFAAIDGGNTSAMTVNASTTSGTLSVSKSASWIYATISSGEVTIYPTAANDGARREGTVTVTATGLDGTMNSKTITVVQEGVVPVTIIASAYQVNFAADAAVDEVREITLFGYDKNIHNFSATPMNGSWFTIVEPSSPMKVVVGGPWTGAAERKANVTITITNDSDGSLVSTFNITVVQDGVIVPNITYAPDIFHNVPVEGTAGSGTNVPLKVTFVNPGAVDLSLINTTFSPSFVSFAEFKGDVLEITVQPNPNHGTRIGNVIVSATDGTTVVKTYTITIEQDGTGAIAPNIYAQFDDGGTVYLENTSEYASPYPVGMTLQPGVTITNAEPVSGTATWLLTANVNGAGDGIEFTYDPAVFNETSTVEGLVRVELLYTSGSTSTPFTMYYHVKYRGELPEIGADWISSVANITAIQTTATVQIDDVLTAPLVLSDLTVSNAVVTYTGIETGWITAPSVVLNDTNGEITLSGISANTGADARSAVVKVTFSATGYKDQVLEFVVNQAGELILSAVYPASVTIEHNEELAEILPLTVGGVTTNVESAEIDVASITVVGGFSTWIDDCGCNATILDQLDFECDPNTDGVPRSATVTFKLKGPAGYQDKDCSIFVVQMPEPPVQPLLTIDNIDPLAFNVGSTASVTYTTDSSVTGVSVFMYDKTLLTPASPTTNQLDVTAKTLNATDDIVDCLLVLAVTDGTVTQYYPVTVPQVSMTSDDLAALFTGFNPTGSENHLSIPTPARVGNSIYFEIPQGGSWVGPDEQRITVSYDPSIEGFSAVYSEISDTPDNFRDTESWDPTNKRMVMNLRGRSWLGNNVNPGTSEFKFTVTFGSGNITAEFNIFIKAL